MSRRHRAAMSVNQSVTEDTSTCFLVCGQIIYLTCEMRRIRELVNKNLFLKIVVLDPILIYIRDTIEILTHPGVVHSFAQRVFTNTFKVLLPMLIKFDKQNKWL